MASFKAVCWASDSFAILSHEGQEGVGNLWSWGPDRSCGDPPLNVQDVPLLTLQLHHSLILCLLLDSLWDLPPCFVVLDPHLSHSWVLLSELWERLWWSPEAIWVHLCSSHLCLLFSYWDLLSIPSKKGAQTCAMWSQTPQSRILAPQFRHIMLPKRWEGSKLQRALLLKGLTTSTQKSLTAGAHLSLYLASLQ